MPKLPRGIAVSGFQVGERIGRGGGSAALYRATGPRGPVALKLFDAGGDDDLRRQLRDELERYAQIEHPGLLPIYEIGEFHGATFIATRIVDEGTLADLVERDGPLAEDRVAAIVEQVADAVAALHQRGFVHAAIAPRNLLLGRGGRGTPGRSVRPRRSQCV